MDYDIMEHHQDKQYPHGHKILDPHDNHHYHANHHHHHHHQNGGHHGGHHHGNHHHHHHGAHHHGKHHHHGHSGHHHHGSHISKLLQYHSQKPNTDTIAEVAETADANDTGHAQTDPYVTETSIKKDISEKDMIEMKLNDESVTKDDLISEKKDDNGSSDITNGVQNNYNLSPNSAIGTTSANIKPDFSPTISIETAVTQYPVYSDVPVLDTNHRELTIRDVEDIISSSPRSRGLHPDASPRSRGLHPDASPRSRGLHPDASPRSRGLHPDASPKESSLSRSPTYKIQKLNDEVPLDVGHGGPWPEDTVPIIDSRNIKGVDKYQNSYFFQSAH